MKISIFISSRGLDKAIGDSGEGRNPSKRLNGASAWAPAFAGVTVGVSHILPPDIDTLPK